MKYNDKIQGNIKAQMYNIKQNKNGNINRYINK